MIASFTLSGVPVAKGRPRLTTRGGVARAYTPAATRRFEAQIADAARAAIGPVDPYTGPVELEAHVLLPIPASWPRRWRTAAATGGLLPHKRPDLDDYGKAIADGLNGVVYADDAQIVSLRMTKRYCEDPGVVVTVRAALEEMR